MWVLCSDSQAYITQNGAAVKLSTGSSGGTGTVAVPSRQILLSGSGTYTTATGARQLRIRMVAGGGGGAASANYNPGGNGGMSLFATVWVSSGIGGNANGSSHVGPTAGGTGGLPAAGVFVSSSIFRLAGGASMGDNGTQLPGSGGGGTHFGSGGASALGGVGTCTAGAANTGTGGGAIGGSGGYVAAGSGGEYAEVIINTPAASYPYIVGAAGSTNAACAGGSGVIIVDEFY